MWWPVELKYVPNTLSESARAVLKDLIENRLLNQRSMNVLSTRGFLSLVLKANYIDNVITPGDFPLQMI